MSLKSTLLDFFESTFGGTQAREGAQTAQDAALAALEEGEPGLLDRASEAAGDLWDTVNPVNVGRRFGETVKGVAQEGLGLAKDTLATTREVAQAGEKTADAAVVGFTETTKMTLIVASSVVLLGILATFAATRGGR